VIGFMSGNQQDPDMMCEVFILAPTDLVDEHELLSQQPASPAWLTPSRPASASQRSSRLAQARSTLDSGGHHVRSALSRAPAARERRNDDAARDCLR
jgi:hypothetical protein